MFYKAVKSLAHFLVLILFNVKFENVENIPKDVSFIISSNHRTYFDPIFLVIKVKGPIKFFAKAELFDNKLSSWFFTKIGAFPVSRGSGDNKPIETAIQGLKEGKPLLIFPEGTRSKTGIPKRARSGISLIAGEAGVGVLPVSIDYGKKLGFRAKITVKFHPLITKEELAIDTSSPRTMRTASKKVMDTIVSGLTMIPDDSKGEAA